MRKFPVDEKIVVCLTRFENLNRYMRFLVAFSHEILRHVFIALRFFDNQCFNELCGSDHNNSGRSFRCNTWTDDMELFT